MPAEEEPRSPWTCSLCGRVQTSDRILSGNNPEPIRDYDDGPCCVPCNDAFVIPIRILRATNHVPVYEW